MSQPKRNGTCGASLLATSAPRGLDTPVTSTRLGVIDSPIYRSGPAAGFTPDGAGYSVTTPRNMDVKWVPLRIPVHRTAPLGIDTPDRRRVGHPLHRERVRRGA